MKTPIGVFDSGYGGLTVLKSIRNYFPENDLVYLGDNARAPYGTRSFDVVYKYTLEAVKYLFSLNCPLVILACNTASSKALRSIQQNDLPKLFPEKKVLGVLRPTTEEIGHYTNTGNVGVLATSGTIDSNSYKIEINKFFPEIKVTQQSCPMWVPLVENNSFLEKGGQYFIEKYIDDIFSKSPNIDTLILACTHYPLLKESIIKYVPKGVNVVEQGNLVSQKLKDYLNRHQLINDKLSKNSSLEILTSENNEKFDRHLNLFYGENLNSKTVNFN
jgi:glutamate racemase